MTHTADMQDLADAKPGVGKNVRAARAAASLSQSSLAAKAGVSLRTIIRIEAGEDTSVSTLQALADSLGVQVAALMGEPAGPAEVAS